MQTLDVGRRLSSYYLYEHSLFHALFWTFVISAVWSITVFLFSRHTAWESLCSFALDKMCPGFILKLLKCCLLCGISMLSGSQAPSSSSCPSTVQWSAEGLDKDLYIQTATVTVLAMDGKRRWLDIQKLVSLDIVSHPYLWKDFVRTVCFLLGGALVAWIANILRICSKYDSR